MHVRKLSILGLAMVLTLGLAGSVWAANLVDMKTTSEPIASVACDKAGSLTFEFDGGTRLEGAVSSPTPDNITVDLPFGVKICGHAIDMVIAPHGDADRTTFLPAGGHGFNATNTPEDPILDAFYVRDSSDNASVAAANNGIVLHVTGALNTQRITIAVIGGSLTFNSGGAGDALVLKLFDQNTNAEFDDNQLWVRANSTAARYSTAADAEDNTLCINAEGYSKDTIEVSYDSARDKYTFTGDNEVAHKAPLNFGLTSCQKETAGDIKIGEGQEGTSCLFEYETANGYCSSNFKGNKIIIEGENTTDTFESATYQLTVSSKTPGVYFGSGTAALTGFTTGKDPCSDPGNVVLASWDALLANGDDATDFDHGDCTVATDAKAVTLESGDITAINTYNALWIDLPNLVYDTSVISAGTDVIIHVTLTKVPCGTIVDEDVTIGTFVTECGATASTTLLYPYFTAMSGDRWWDGIVVTNVSSSAGTANLTWYEKDGDQATASVSVGANSHYVGLVGSITWTKTAGTGTLGDTSGYISATTNFSASGFAMIANSATGESMGYLPE